MTSSPSRRFRSVLLLGCVLAWSACADSTSSPAATAPDTTAPDTTAPDTTAPDTTAPDTTAPDTTAPDTSSESETTPVRITQQQVDEFVNGWVAANPDLAITAGISIAVSTPAATLVAAGGNAGSADRPLTPDTWMRMGSVTKTYVATALLRLATAGRLDLDRTVTSLLPSAPLSPGTTVRQLLAMTAGVPDFLENPAWRTEITAAPARRWSLGDVMTLVPSTPATPGAFSYCNSCYIVAGQILELITGTDYATAISDLVLAPLDLESTDSSGVGHQPADGTIIVDEETAPLLTNTLPSYDAIETTAGTAGSMLATAADVTAFGRALLDGDALDGQRWDEMRRFDADGHYGLGLADFGALTAGQSINVQALGNYGEIPGFTTALLLFPSDSMVITVMTNHDDVPGLVIATDLGRSLGVG